MGKEPGKVGGDIRKQCKSDPSREGWEECWEEASQSTMQGKEVLARQSGSLRTIACHLRSSVSFKNRTAMHSHWLGAVCGKAGVGTTVEVGFRV